MKSKSKFWFLVGYSLKKKVKSKAFIITNVIISLLIILIINLPGIIASTSKNDDVKIVVYDDTNKIKNYLENTDGYTYIFNTGFNKDNVKTTLEDSDMVINTYYESTTLKADIYTDGTLSATDELYVETMINNAKVKVWEETASEEAKAQVSDYLSNVVFNNIDITGEDDSAQKAILGTLAMIISLPIFLLLVLTISFVGADILEEKSSRSIEYIISNVKPQQHFLSKIVGAMLFVLIQLGIILVAVLLGSLLANFTGSSLTSVISMLGEGSVSPSGSLEGIASKLPLMIIVSVLFIVLGFVMYLVSMALCSSMSTSMEDYNQFISPVMIIIIVGFYVGLFSAFSPGNIIIKIIGYIPLFSPLLGPVLFINGTFTIVDVIISFLLLVGVDVLLLKIGSPLYKVSILDYTQGKFFNKLKQIIRKSKYSD